MNDRWGPCRTCRYFASPSNAPEDEDRARCLHPVHSRLDLVVTGASGCTGWELRPGLAREQAESELQEQPPA
ncbi:MAG: hypothetical protein DIU72_002935 [Pseudomonadota bacterium]|nr:MAG: hypothetical protein DIU72_00575 [Pseudomonadota bacterium]